LSARQPRQRTLTGTRIAGRGGGSAGVRDTDTFDESAYETFILPGDTTYRCPELMTWTGTINRGSLPTVTMLDGVFYNGPGTDSSFFRFTYKRWRVVDYGTPGGPPYWVYHHESLKVEAVHGFTNSVVCATWYFDDNSADYYSSYNYAEVSYSWDFTDLASNTHTAWVAAQGWDQPD
jgi:hypothetical protein